jgi:nicotinate-nucleotide adenylyltransferase
MLEISATDIRDNIREGRTIRYLVPDKVREEIESNRYYR